MLRLNLYSLSELNMVSKEICIVLNLDNKQLRTNCVAFYGEMGAGKTTLIKAICKELGVMDNISSPSFSLVNEYITNKGDRVFHFDFYRINTTSEAFDLGYEEYFYSGELCLIEWPEKIEQLLPGVHTRINVHLMNNDKRLVEVL